VRVLAGGSSDNLPVQATLDVDSSYEITPIQWRQLVAQPTMADGTPLARVGGGVSAPVALNMVEAQFSDEARNAHYEGVCIVQVIVDAKGNPQNPRIVRALGLGLDAKAIEAVKRYKFKPAMKNGTPVPVMISVQVNFRLYERN